MKSLKTLIEDIININYCIFMVVYSRGPFTLKLS